MLLLAKLSSSTDEDVKWDGILIAGGTDEVHVPQPYFQIINPLKNTQQTIPTSKNIPELFHMAATTFDDGSTYKIYFTGGHTAELEALKTVVLFVHTPTKNQVSKVSNMTKVRDSK